jgi:hypothetical protein
MTLRKVRPADVLTGVAGLALLVVMFFPWYELIEGVQDGGRIVAPDDVEQSAWESFGPLLVLLVLTSLLAMAVLVLTAFQRTVAWPVAAQVFGAAIAFITLLWLLVRLIDEPGSDTLSDVRWGAWAGLAAVLAINVGVWLSMRDEERP